MMLASLTEIEDFIGDGEKLRESATALDQVVRVAVCETLRSKT